MLVAGLSIHGLTDAVRRKNSFHKNEKMKNQIQHQLCWIAVSFFNSLSFK